VERAANLAAIEPLPVAGDEDGWRRAAMEFAKEDARQSLADCRRRTRGYFGKPNLEEVFAERDLPHRVDVGADEDADGGGWALWRKFTPDGGEEVFTGLWRGENELDLHPSAV